MNDLPAKVNPDSHRFHFNVTYYKEVLGVFKSISALKAAGLDNIPLKLVKDAAEELATPLTTLVNRSLTCGLFPTAEKAAKISPINKSEDKTALDNYRPISVMPVFSKVLERVVYNRLSYYLEENNLLNDYQYGFSQKRSTKHAVTILMDDIRTSMDNQQLTGAVFLDLRKAFNTVNHACLFNKLPSYGINDVELMWVSSYLFARTQVVNFKGTFSEENYITHRVPQGFILGPLLFALLINEVGTDLSQCKIILYADDTVIYFSDKNASIIESTLNEEVNRIAIWMRDNHLTLNLKKGKTDFVLYGTAKKLSKELHKINVHINGEKVNEATKYMYLGVLLDQHLNLHDHLATTYKKASSRIKLLKCIRPSLTSAIAGKVYHSMIQPIVTYSPNCSPATSKLPDRQNSGNPGPRKAYRVPQGSDNTMETNCRCH
jgi:hypothetical protein